MECAATRDKKNPRWNDLLDHVEELNDQLMALANFCLGDNVKAQLTDDMLPRATSSIADACLEVTDATCVTMATMRSIICKHVAETERRSNNLENVSNDNSENDEAGEITESLPITRPGKEELERVMSMMEMALSLSKSKKEVDSVHVLEQAISMMKRLAQGRECFHFWLEKVRNKNVTKKKWPWPPRQTGLQNTQPTASENFMHELGKKEISHVSCVFFLFSNPPPVLGMKLCIHACESSKLCLISGGIMALKSHHQDLCTS